MSVGDTWIFLTVYTSRSKLNAYVIGIPQKGRCAFISLSQSESRLPGNSVGVLFGNGEFT